MLHKFLSNERETSFLVWNEDWQELIQLNDENLQNYKKYKHISNK